MFVQIIALWPKMALIRGSIVLHRLIKGIVKSTGERFRATMALLFENGVDQDQLASDKAI